MTPDSAGLDLGEYCRRVEAHLTKANAGHLVRIVGPGFDLVRAWAEAGVPLSVVYRGIDLKADRHKEGTARRPLRIEFCAGDVQALFDHWRRAVGLGVFVQDPEPGDSTGATQAGQSEDTAQVSPKRRSLSRHLDRVIDRLSRASGRLDIPDGLRAECARILDVLASLRETSARRRGPERDDAERMLSALDGELAAAARTFAPEAWMTSLRDEAAADLAPFRSRLAAEAWTHSMDVTVDRLLRDRLGLPVLAL